MTPPMERFLVTAGTPLRGAVAAGGAKNSALKIMAATLLAPGTYDIERVPRIADVETMGRVLGGLGARAAFTAARWTSPLPSSLATEAPSGLVRQMRASIIVLGPLLARCRKAPEQR